MGFWTRQAMELFLEGEGAQVWEAQMETDDMQFCITYCEK